VDGAVLTNIHIGRKGRDGSSAAGLSSLDLTSFGSIDDTGWGRIC
jgi:hypothetical protein